MTKLVLMVALLAGCDGVSDDFEACVSDPELQCEPICNETPDSTSIDACGALDADGEEILCGDTIEVDGLRGCCFTRFSGDVTRFAECE